MVPENKFFQMHPTGLYITHSFDRAWIQYAGDDAEKSHAVLEIPFDPTFLRKLGRELNKLAKTIEGERG